MEATFIEHWRGSLRVVGEFQPGNGFVVYDSTLPATDQREPGQFLTGFADLVTALIWAQQNEEFVQLRAANPHWRRSTDNPN
jgi:hypothetical protein